MPAGDYDPRPIDTAHVRLSPDVAGLVERLARNAHDIWARRRMDDGWRFGPQRDDLRKEHPSLVPYEKLDDTEKAYDRVMVCGVVRSLLALGYRIERT
jgi:hypothetical protein